MIDEFFRRHPFCLMLLIGLLVIPCLLFVAAGLISFYFDPIDYPYIVFLGPLGIVIVGVAFYTYCTTFCSESHNEFTIEQLVKFKGRLVLGVILLSCVLVFFVKVNIAWIPPTFQEHISYEQLRMGSAPPSGTDYSYRRLPRGSGYCECTITEKNFDDWITSESRWERRTIITEEKPEHIDNFMQRDEIIIVTDGIKVGYGKGRGGQAVFDRKTNRAYYWTYY